MKKYLPLFFIGLAILSSIIYYTGIYTYFIRTEVMEPLPPAAISEPDSMSIVASGSFGEIDFIHKGSGSAKLIRIVEDKILRLDDFSVTSGPDLYVYLARSESPTNDLGSLGDFVDLGPLKGTMGNQNYVIPSGVSDDNRTVVIWCKRFSVLFSYAVMK